MSEAISVMEFAEDLNNQEAPPPLPAQEYPAEIVSAAFKVSANSGNTYLALNFKISADHYPADFEGGNPEGETLGYNRLVVLPETPGRRYAIRKFLESVGAKVGKSLDPNDLMGLSATVGVTHQDYEGEKRAQIAKVTSA